MGDTRECGTHVNMGHIWIRDTYEYETFVNEPVTYMKINRQTKVQTKATLRHRQKQHDAGTDKSKQTKATLKIKTQTKDHDADKRHKHRQQLLLSVPVSFVCVFIFGLCLLWQKTQIHTSCQDTDKRHCRRHTHTRHRQKRRTKNLCLHLWTKRVNLCLLSVSCDKMCESVSVLCESVSLDTDKRHRPKMQTQTNDSHICVSRKMCESVSLFCVCVVCPCLVSESFASVFIWCLNLLSVPLICVFIFCPYLYLSYVSFVCVFIFGLSLLPLSLFCVWVLCLCLLTRLLSTSLSFVCDFIFCLCLYLFYVSFVCFFIFGLCL